MLGRMALELGERGELSNTFHTSDSLTGWLGGLMLRFDSEGARECETALILLSLIHQI